MHFHEYKFCISIQIPLKLVPKGPIDNTPALNRPNRRQNIIWTNADLNHWHIYAAVGGNDKHSVCDATVRRQSSLPNLNRHGHWKSTSHYFESWWCIDTERLVGCWNRNFVNVDRQTFQRFHRLWKNAHAHHLRLKSRSGLFFMPVLWVECIWCWCNVTKRWCGQLDFAIFAVLRISFYAISLKHYNDVDVNSLLSLQIKMGRRNSSLSKCLHANKTAFYRTSSKKLNRMWRNILP